MYLAHTSPGTRPNPTQSRSKFPPNRLLHSRPPATSPAAWIPRVAWETGPPLQNCHHEIVEGIGRMRNQLAEEDLLLNMPWRTGGRLCIKTTWWTAFSAWSDPLPLAASSAANNYVSEGLTTDGNVRIDKVPAQLDLAPAQSELVDKFKVQSEVVRTVTERADESGQMVACESSADKHVSDDMLTMRTTNDIQAARKGGEFWGCTSFPECRGTRQRVERSLLLRGHKKSRQWLLQFPSWSWNKPFSSRVASLFYVNLSRTASYGPPPVPSAPRSTSTSEWLRTHRGAESGHPSASGSWRHNFRSLSSRTNRGAKSGHPSASGSWRELSQSSNKNESRSRERMFLCLGAGWLHMTECNSRLLRWPRPQSLWKTFQAVTVVPFWTSATTERRASLQMNLNIGTKVEVERLVPHERVQRRINEQIEEEPLPQNGCGAAGGSHHERGRWKQTCFGCVDERSAFSEEENILPWSCWCFNKHKHARSNLRLSLLPCTRGGCTRSASKESQKHIVTVKTRGMAWWKHREPISVNSVRLPTDPLVPVRRELWISLSCHALDMFGYTFQALQIFISDSKKLEQLFGCCLRCRTEVVKYTLITLRFSASLREQRNKCKNICQTKPRLMDALGD